MGCVTSKVMTRTGSFQEELSRSLKRRQAAGGFPALQHLLVSGSTDVADGFLLVYDHPDQKQPYKPTSESSTSTGSQDIIINTWDLMAGLDDQEDNQTVQGQGSRDLSKRSQSFHVSSNDTESPFRIKEDGKGSSNISLRSKSFHTVDEYDAIMMERNQKPEMDWDRLEDFLNKVTSRERESKLVDAETTENCENVGSCTSAINDDDDNKGVRRKTRANDLTSLAIPSTIEFPVIESLKSWIADAQTPVNNHSPPTDYMYYLTPKFGSFGLPIPYNKEKEEEYVLDPDMVSSLEVAMEQLQVEEEFLQQITKTFEDDDHQLSQGLHG